MFRRARQNRVFQDVVEQIQQAILDGRLKSGDKLPPERELKEMFETSRGSLREALRVLEQKGLIDIKLGVGGGAVVRSVSAAKVGESLALLIRQRRVSLAHLAEFREGVEGVVAGLAAARAGEEDIASLQQLLSEAGARIGNAVDWDGFVRLDEKIHLSLARITGNPLFIWVLQTVHDNIHQYYESYLPREPEVLRENYRDLCEIVAAVSSGKAQQAQSLAQDHVRRFNRHMMERQSQQATEAGDD
jgi:GntR family transcriptional repressor for pyruvate dehydrogenase complex